jgi:dienelactone hydrolase
MQDMRRNGSVIYSCKLALLLVVSLAGFSSPAIGVSPAGPAPAILPLAADETVAVDATRYTAQNLDWTDTGRNRNVPARLYLPAAPHVPGSLPLVVFSHGIGGSRDGYSYLGRYLAANGYASLHVQHVGSDRQVWFGNPFSMVSRLSDAAQESEALNRVQDVRFALDRILEPGASPPIDARRVVVAGHSYGANTAMLVAGARVDPQGGRALLKDPRVSAAILISAPPFYGLGDPKRILSGIDIPTLHITATADDIQIPGYFSGLPDRLEIFKAMGSDSSAPKVLAVFREGSHSMFTDRMGTGGSALNPRVKIATRQLALAFLDGLQSGSFVALQRWPMTHADIVATFERRAL